MPTSCSSTHFRVFLAAIAMAFAQLTHGGTEDLKFSAPEKSNQGESIKIKITGGTLVQGGTVVTVTNILTTDGAAGKALKIKDAINTQLHIGAKIDAKDAKEETVSTPGYLMTVVGDKTREPKLHASLDLPLPGSVVAEVAYGGSVNGMDSSGNASIFSASLGFDGLTDTASVTFNPTSASTVDDILSQLYGQLLSGLPSNFASNLLLDLAGDKILFELPDGKTNYFVENFSSDMDVEVLGGLQLVPEPGTLNLVAAAFALLGYQRRRLT